MSIDQPGFEPEPMNQEAKSKKELAWDQKRAEVDTIGDGIGTGIDEKVKEPVTALLMYGFSTEASCAGHLSLEDGDDHGESYPWIRIDSPEPAGWEENEEKQLEWKTANLKQQKKMMDLLTEFYAKQKTPFNDAQLAFDRVGAFGGFCLQSFAAEMTMLLSPEEKLVKLELYRKEMNDFTNFLKEKYLSN